MIMLSDGMTIPKWANAGSVNNKIRAIVRLVRMDMNSFITTSLIHMLETLESSYRFVVHIPIDFNSLSLKDQYRSSLI